MSFIKNKTIWIICVLSFIAALLYNQLNLKHLPEEQKRDHQTVRTNDDASYLTPPLNYMETGEWKDNITGKQAYFLRPPGYGLFYMALAKLGDFSSALMLLKISQLLLFALSVYWFYYITNTLLQHRKTALILATIYGISPFFIGFLFYSLTEGITPALLLLYIFLLIKAYDKTNYRQKNGYYFLAALCFSYLLIVRPALGLWGLLIPVFLIKSYWKKGILNMILKLILFGAVAFSFMLIWQIRNYKIAGEYVGLHPIYYTDNNTMFRPTLQEFWEFNKSWGVEGHVYHSYSLPFWQAAIKGDTSIIYIDNILNAFPDEVITYFGKPRLIKVFRKYQRSVLFQKPYYEQHLPMPKKSNAIEQEVVDEFKQLTKECRKEFWMQYYIIAPLKVFKVMAFHSNLSLYIFQHTYRGIFLMEVLRYFFFSLHSLCFIALFFSLFFLRNSDWRQNAITLIAFAYVFYLCYVQRGIEERYTLPILPLLLIGLVYFVKQRIKLLRGKP